MPNPNDVLAKIEQRHLWAYFHKDWLIEIRASLRKQLPQEYHVFVESETVLLSLGSNGSIVKSQPDIAVARADHAASKPALTESSATAAVVEFDEPYELFNKYSLVIRRSPHDRVIAAVEMLSPSNKGLATRSDREKYLLKRDSYTEAGINFFEIDALIDGERLFPESLRKLQGFERNAWTALHDPNSRRVRGYGWNSNQRLPVVGWDVEQGVQVLVDLDQTARAAAEFNHWTKLIEDAGG